MSNPSDTISDDRKTYLDELVRKSNIAAAAFTWPGYTQKVTLNYQQL